jgi:tyrosine phenol-lyase
MSEEEFDELIAEPYKIKVVEPIRKTVRVERERLIAEVGYNVGLIRSEDVYIDLSTDSGTSAMSDYQWAGLMLGDEAYHGSRNFYNLVQAVADVMGFQYVVPTHQGRGAENILFQTLLKPGDVVPGNTHFDTTRLHIERSGGNPVNLVPDYAYDLQSSHPFKGNFDLEKLERLVSEVDNERIPLILITVTNNAIGGHPISMENIRSVKTIAERHGIPLFFDAARFAENAYMIQQRESMYSGNPVSKIVGEMFSLADGCTMSAKKDGLVNIGGFIGVNSEELYRRLTALLVVYEGFATYGGLAGRDMEAMARGLREVVDDDYLASRIRQVSYLAKLLRDKDVPILEPPGGHAVYLDTLKFLPHVPQSQFPGVAILIEIYIEAGVRAVELGTLVFGKKDPKTGENIYPKLELVRLAIPRRVYTNQHMEVVANAVIRVFRRREKIMGLKIVYEPPVLRHFLARFEWLQD